MSFCVCINIYILHVVGVVFSFISFISIAVTCEMKTIFFTCKIKTNFLWFFLSFELGYILILRTVYFWCAYYLCDVIWTLLSATRSPLKKRLNYHKNATFNHVLHSFAIIFTICNMDLLPIFLIRWTKRRPMWPTVFFFTFVGMLFRFH